MQDNKRGLVLEGEIDEIPVLVSIDKIRPEEQNYSTGQKTEYTFLFNNTETKVVQVLTSEGANFYSERKEETICIFVTSKEFLPADSCRDSLLFQTLLTENLFYSSFFTFYNKNIHSYGEKTDIGRGYPA